MILGIRNAGMAWSTGNTGSLTYRNISDHGRGPISMTPERIENSIRTVDGTMRRQVIATKYKYSCDWSNLPSVSSRTVDENLGGYEIKNFFETITGAFGIKFYVGNSNATNTTLTDTITKIVMFNSFSYEIAGRSQSGIDLVNISVELEEV